MGRTWLRGAFSHVLKGRVASASVRDGGETLAAGVAGAARTGEGALRRAAAAPTSLAGALPTEPVW
jgi:hypothetical protein